MNHLRYLTILLLAAIAWSCTNVKKENNKNIPVTPVLVAGDSPIRQINVLYYNYMVDEDDATNCDDLALNLPSFESADYRGVLDATIDNVDVLSEIKKQMLLLHSVVEVSVQNILLTAIIEYENGATDKLCIGGHNGSTILLDGVEQSANNRLVYLLKNNAGYYPWLIGDALFSLPELIDTSFMKEPFVSSVYYKQWQNNRSEAD